jgi:hypothetical protein
MTGLFTLSRLTTAAWATKVPTVFGISVICLPNMGVYKSPLIRLKAIHHKSLGMYPARLGIHCASLGIHRASLGIHRKSLGIHPASLGMYSASLGIHRKSLGIHPASARIHPKGLGTVSILRLLLLF